jgi:gamma-glutamylputrescine oxidase
MSMTAQRSADPTVPGSYWHATFAPPVPADPLPAGTDVAVVGGGLLGCWTAYWLAKRGVNVTLIERDVISWGATGRNGGFLTGGAAIGYGDAIDRFGRDAARAVFALSAEGRSLAEQVIADEEIDCDFRIPGILSLALTDGALASMHRSAELMREDGFAGELLDRQAAQDMIRTPLGSEVTGGALAPDGGLVHSGRYLAGVAAAARRHGARFCRAAVTALTSCDEGVTLSTSAGSIRAQRVVVAVNAWSDELVPGLAGLVVPVRGQILAYEPRAQVFQTGLGTDITPTGEYWQQTPDGSIVIGGCRAEAPHGDVGVRDMVPTPDVTRAIEAVLPRLFPALDGLQVARRWAGLMAFTSDYLPVADAAPDLSGVWVTGGFCGHGMPFGPRVGQLLAEAVATGETPAALHPLRLGRETLTLLSPPDTLVEPGLVFGSE